MGVTTYTGRHRRRRSVWGRLAALWLTLVYRPAPVVHSRARRPWSAERIALVVPVEKHLAYVAEMDSYVNGARAPVA